MFCRDKSYYWAIFVHDVGLRKCKNSRIENYRFKSVEVYALPNETENAVELYIYLLDNDLNDIFTLFIQNILEDIVKCTTENEALRTTLNVISKWKKLFDKINFNGLTQEQQKGLIGELLFFNYLLNNQKTSGSILNAWTGADFEDKDFIFGSVGVEIKLTSLKHPKIRITSERQLDTENLNELFLILYTTEEVRENGFTLNSLVEQVRKKILSIDERNFFDERLLLIGYRDNDREYYNKIYSLKKTFAFSITPGFPKIVKSQLPLGLYNASYSIELSAVESFMIDIKNIISKI